MRQCRKASAVSPCSLLASVPQAGICARPSVEASGFHSLLSGVRATQNFTHPLSFPVLHPLFLGRSPARAIRGACRLPAGFHWTWLGVGAGGLPAGPPVSLPPGSPGAARSVPGLPGAIFKNKSLVI